MPGGVVPVDSSGEVGDGLAVAGEGGSVGHAVDAVGGAGDDGASSVGESCGEFHGDVFPVSGCGARTNDRDLVGTGEQLGVAAHPKSEGCRVAEVVHSVRPPVFWSIPCVSAFDDESGNGVDRGCC